MILYMRKEEMPLRYFADCEKELNLAVKIMI